MRITDADITNIAKEYDVEEAHVRAVMEVESRGRGFDSKGRVVILFEPHIFYREIKDPKIRAEAVARGLAYQKWGTMRYPADSYTRFNPAFGLDPEAAMLSCSWGLAQIMGFNHKVIGFESVGKMVDSFKKSEANQLRGMMEFIKANKLDGHLRKRDWHSFARGYNGSGYAKNKYHTKLAEAYEKWKPK